MGRRWALGGLVGALLLLAAGGFYGGLSMLLDPTGEAMGVNVVLPQLPVSSFAWPGAFLLVFMGLVPLALAYALVARPSWRWGTALARWSGHHWAWAGTVALGVLLGVWLAVQGWLIGFAWPIQYATAAIAVAIVALAALPSVHRSFAAPHG